jgi:hypothetical protein
LFLQICNDRATTPGGLMTRSLAAFAAAAILALPGCATVAESRIRTALTDAGLSAPVSSCIADRMVDKLSMAQLRSIGRLSEGSRKELTLPEFLQYYQAALDPEIYAVIAKAGIGCALTA